MLGQVYLNQDLRKRKYGPLDASLECIEPM